MVLGGHQPSANVKDFTLPLFLRLCSRHSVVSMTEEREEESRILACDVRIFVIHKRKTNDDFFVW